METIRVTFPVIIPKEKVKLIIEGNLKKNSGYTCEVEFQTLEDGENVFLISSTEPNAFYLIGMTAATMIHMLT